MGVVLALLLQLVNLCIIGFLVTLQGSEGSIISPSPSFLPVVHPREKAPGPVHHGQSLGSSAPSSSSDPDGFVLSPSPANLPLKSSPSEAPSLLHSREPWRAIAPSFPEVPNGSFLHPSVTLQPAASAPTPQTVKGFDPSVSPSPSTSTITSSPLYKASPAPSTDKGNVPPSIQSSPPQRITPAVRPPIPTPSAPAPVVIPSSNLPRTSPISQPIENGGFPPKVDKRNESKSHEQEPISQAPVTSPSSSLPVEPPLVHPVISAASPSKLPAPVLSPALSPSRSLIWKNGGEPVSAPLYKAPKPLSVIVHSPAQAPVVSPALTPSRSFSWKKGGKPVSAPLYKTPNPLPAVVHSPAQAPAAHKVRQFQPVPEPLISSPKSPFNKGDHSPISSPSTTFYWHHHTRKTIPSPAPASTYLLSPPTSKHQDQLFPPTLQPTSRQRPHTSPPMNTGPSVSPISFPIQPPVSQVYPAPSPTKIPFHPPKVSPSRSSSKRPKKPVLPHVPALPPPPPNEDCLSTVCSEPYTNSPPGAPCRCVWPMKVGLRLSVSVYTFFPLVSELASEIATGVFMRQSQVRIMGANAAGQEQDKTDVLIDLVPLGEEFDNTTAFLTSERFWHKQVVIKTSYFGEYDVLYVSYPGLPPSPPLPPSSISIIDGGPYSSGGNNGRTIKPLGVDIPKRQHKGGLSKGIIAIIAVSVFLAFVSCVAAVWALLKCRDHTSQPTSTPRVLPPSLAKTPGAAGSLGGGVLASTSSSFRSSIAAYTGSAKTFSMNDIEKATDNFHASRVLGEGGFGRVYSGILEDGTKVAVKVLKREDHHGDREFLSEVEMLSRLHHRNLVKLIGICTEVSFRCLVYELIPNGSVESHLHGVDKEKSPLDWSARIKIALGAARGLAYLHEDSSPHVIHRDFKSSNILLEDDFTPKVSDFGLARTAADERSRHISTRVMGTFGYVAPEYAMTGHLLVKSDVYSYGVVLLELLTGRKPVDMTRPSGQENLVAWARPLLSSKEGLEAIIDPSLGTDVPVDSVAKVAAIASMCVQPEVSDRPFMGEVVQALKLVCNECDEAREAGSSSSQEDLSVDLNNSRQLSDNFQAQFSATNYDSGVDIENGLSASELFSSSARFGRQVSGSFRRRHSYSGPLRTGRSERLWQIIRRLSRGSVSEHGIMFKS